MIKQVPAADNKAASHFDRAIRLSREIGAKNLTGQACPDLGLVHKAKGRPDRARECISESARIFEQCEAQTFLRKAREELASLE